MRKAKASVDRALELQPDLPEAHLALGNYYYWVHREYEKALAEFAIAEKGLPNNSRVLASVAYVWRRQGRFQDAVSNLQKAFRLDPGDIDVEYNIIETLTILGSYPEAMRLVDRAISVHPEREVFYHFKFLLCVHQDSLRQARAVLFEAPSGQVNWLLLLSMLERDYQTALDSLTLRENNWRKCDYEFSFWTRDGMIGRIYQFMGDTSRALASFESARLFLESHTEELGVQFGFHSELGVVYAGLGRKQEAIREGRLSLDRMPISKDAMVGARLTRKMALIYVMVGEYEAAIELLELLMSVPYSNGSIVTLRLHPDWDPLRDHPRFQALLEKYDSR